MNATVAPRSLISIGTNSTRLVILDGERVAVAQSVGTRLGRGLDRDGKLDPAAAALTLATIRDYVARIREHGATIDTIATSALRRAGDAIEFCASVAEVTGAAPRIISGDEEAAYSFSGATWGATGSGRLGVLDVGGGSTELAVGTSGAIERTISLEIGAVRLSERVPELLGQRGLDSDARAAVLERARAVVEPILAPLATFAGFSELLAVGGTVFTAGAMIAGDPRRDAVAIDRARRRSLIDELLSRSLDERRAIAHIRPQRADILPAGLIVVDTACDLLEIDILRVSHADLLVGYLRSPAYRAASLPDPHAKEDRAPPGSNTRAMG